MGDAVRWSEVRARRVPDERAVAAHGARLAAAEREITEEQDSELAE